jgi:hypothetical protein
MRLSEMTDEQAGRALLKSYRAACDCHDGVSTHPSHEVNGWIKAARDARKARDAAANTTGGSLLETGDVPRAQDSAIDPAAARAARALNSIPGYSRIRTGTPPEDQTRFFTKS